MTSEALQIISETSSPDLFEAQATTFPGLRYWISHWPELCICGNPRCIRETLQHHGARWRQSFPNNELLHLFLYLLECIPTDMRAKDGIVTAFVFTCKIADGDRTALAQLKYITRTS